MQLCAPANAVLPLSQPRPSLVLVRPLQGSSRRSCQLALLQLADGRVPHLVSWPMIFVFGALAGAIVVVLTRIGLRLRARAQQPPAQQPPAQQSSAQQASASLPQPASAPVAVAPSRDEAPARAQAASVPGESPAGAIPAASAAAGTVTAVRKLLADLEDLKVTLADGPPALVERLLTTVAAEVRLGSADREAAWADQGRRAVILVGFDGHHDAPGPTPATACVQPGAEIIRRETVGAALDLIAAKAVTTRRSLTETATGAGQPEDADFGLTLLVSRIAPARSELSLLIDLVDEPGRVAALLPAHGPASASTPPGKVNVVMVKPVGSDLETVIAVAPQPATQPADLAHSSPPVAKPAIPASAAQATVTPAPVAAAVVTADPPDIAPTTSVSIFLGTASADPATVRTAPSRPGRGPAAQELRRPEPQRSIPPARLRIGLLGQLTINGQPGALLPAQTQLIVALAVNGPAGLSNGQLCDLLGADADHPKPADSLRQLIARTRRQLGQADDGKEWIIHLGHGQYALHPNSRVDWQEFQTLTDDGMAAKDGGKLAAALSMIRGQPFTGCYYWWLDFELVDSVNAKIVAGAIALGELALAIPDPAAAARAARVGLVADATAEELWRMLMRAEHAAGNLAGVRDAWSRCGDAVAEVAADGQPQRATAALYRSLTGRNLER